MTACKHDPPEAGSNDGLARLVATDGRCSNLSGSDWSELLAQLRGLGARIARYERNVVNLIASDNAVPLARIPVYPGHVIQEGLAGRRPFAGARLHDALEEAAAAVACRVFSAEHANVQPHSCSQANQAVYHALLSPGDTVLSLSFRAGGHLTHGMRSNFSGRHFRFVHFSVGSDERIDYETALSLAKEHRPKLVVCGSSSYPRLYDAERLRAMADAAGAHLMFDLSHEGGLIAGRALANIVPTSDVTTMSTDKTLRGPFGGIILCRSELSAAIDKAVHPGTQSSFQLRKIADTAQALIITQFAEFGRYASAVLANARELERAFDAEHLFTGGTDKHYVVLNVRKAFAIDGATAERRLEHLGILVSRQSIPSDVSGKMSDASAVRLGTAWITSRGYDRDDVRAIAEVVHSALADADGDRPRPHLVNRVAALCERIRENDVWRSRDDPS